MPRATQWAPNILYFNADPARTTLSASYHVFSLLAAHVATENLPSESADLGPFCYAAGRNRDKIRGCSSSREPSTIARQTLPVSVSFEGVGQGANAQLTVLTAEDPMASNVVGGHEAVIDTRASVTAGPRGTFEFSLPNMSVAVLVVEWSGTHSSGQAQ